MKLHLWLLFRPAGFFPFFFFSASLLVALGFSFGKSWAASACEAGREGRWEEHACHVLSLVSPTGYLKTTFLRESHLKMRFSWSSLTPILERSFIGDYDYQDSVEAWG